MQLHRVITPTVFGALSTLTRELSAFYGSLFWFAVQNWHQLAPMNSLWVQHIRTRTTAASFTNTLLQLRVTEAHSSRPSCDRTSCELQLGHAHPHATGSFCTVIPPLGSTVKFTTFGTYTCNELRKECTYRTSRPRVVVNHSSLDAANTKN